VRVSARQEDDPHGTVPAAHPSAADTKVTAAGAKPAGTGVADTAGTVVGSVGTVAAEPGRVEGVTDGTVLGPPVGWVAGVTTPTRRLPPGQLTAANTTAAATAAATNASGQRGRASRRCTGAG